MEDSSGSIPSAHSAAPFGREPTTAPLRAPGAHGVSVPYVSWDEAERGSFAYEPGLLDLRWTLASGQAFRWRETADGWWVGVVRGSVLRIRGEGPMYAWEAYPGLPELGFWHDYLRLGFDLAGTYRELGARDPHLAAAFHSWAGMRILRQAPMETITSFLCATATSIPRIVRAVEGMSRIWGAPIAEIDGHAYHAFPEPQAFTAETVPVLERECNLGYRARRLVQAMEVVSGRPAGWAEGLRALPFAEARVELMALPGIGPKVADCICLFALDKDEAVPVDTHVRQIAVELYLPAMARRSLTANAYAEIAGAFRERFGGRAGWAQQYLFFSHLMRHRDVPRL